MEKSSTWMRRITSKVDEIRWIYIYVAYLASNFIQLIFISFHVHDWRSPFMQSIQLIIRPWFLPHTHTHTTLQPFRLLTLFVLNFNNPFARWHGVLMPPNKRYSPWSPLGLCDAFEFWIIYFENVAHERIFVSVCFARPTDRPSARSRSHRIFIAALQLRVGCI